MRNILGTNLTLTLFGESHNQFIGATLDGVCPGIKVDDEFIKQQLSKRRPKLNIETPRVENDNYQIISGVFNGYTTGAPLTILIENTNIKSKDYDYGFEESKKRIEKLINNYNSKQNNKNK